MSNSRKFRRALSVLNGSGMLRPGEDQAVGESDADETHEAPAGAVNGYACTECHKMTFVIHKDAGVTPIYLACQVTEECTGVAQSIRYPNQDMVPERIRNAVNLEWYRPSQDELELLSPEMQEHVKKGALVLRPLER